MRGAPIPFELGWGQAKDGENLQVTGRALQGALGLSALPS